MDPDQDPPRRVPAPRIGGGDAGGETGGEAWCPFVPVPRGAPTIESGPGRAAPLTERAAVPTAALVLAPGTSAALAVR